MKRERAMKKRLLIVTNHSYMFWQFRRELAEALQKEYEVILAMPFVGHEEDFQNMGIQCIPISMNRRGVNPFTEAKLLWDYERLLKKVKPDLILTYSIKPNIYIGLLSGRKQIPYYANVQGLGTAFQKPVLTGLVTILYRKALQKVKYVKTKKMPVNFVKEKSYPPIARSSWPEQELIWKDTKCSLIRSTHESISCILDEL